MAPSTSCTSLMSAVVVLLLLFPVAPEPLSPSAQRILAACKTVGGGGNTYVSVQFCEEALGSVAGLVYSLDYQDLAGLAVGLLVANATSTEDKIDRLLRGGGGDVKLKAEDDAAVARCLQSCKSLYGGIVDAGPACTTAIKARKFGEAAATLEKAAAAAKQCEDGFRKGNVASPLTAEDDDAYKLAMLGVSFLGFA